MWTAPGPLSLTHRIVGSVGLGLGLILLLFGLVAFWTIQESTEAAYRERVALARAVAWHTDTVLRYAELRVQQEAADLTLGLDGSLPAEQRRRLAELPERGSTFVRLAVTDASGEPRWADAGWQGVLWNTAVLPSCLDQVLRTGEPQVATLPADSGERSELACLAAPVRAPDGRLTGVLLAALDPVSAAPSLLPVDQLSSGMHVELVDGHSHPLTTSGEHVVPSVETAHQPLLSALIDSRTAGHAIHEFQPWDDKASHLVAYAPLAEHPTWGIVVEQPQDLAIAVPRRLTWRLGLFGAAALCLAVAVAWLDVRRVVRPLRDLTRVAERFAAGQLDTPVKVGRADELGILGRAFETMRRRLHASLAEVAEWNQELERRVAARTAEVEARNRELAHLNAIAEVITGSRDTTPMLERALAQVRAISGAEAGCFLITTDDGAGLKVAAEHGLTASLRTACLNGSCDLQEPALWSAIRANGEGPVPVPVAAAWQAAGLHGRLTIPLSSGEGPQGVLVLAAQRADHFPPAAQAILSAVGRQVGLALANARLYEHLRRRERERAELLQQVIAGQEEERRRLAQELHDDASQALASLQFGLERLATETVDLAEARSLANQLRHVATQTLTEVHRLAVELRPSVLDDIGLAAAIERYLHAAARQGQLGVDFAAVDMEGFRLIAAAETAVFRVVQAALTNIVQHADAQHASVLVQRRDEKLVVVVEDDGRGFDLAAVRASGLEARLGLAGMEERASLIGATLTFETAPGAGTTVFLEVPLTANTRREDSDDSAADLAG